MPSVEQALFELEGRGVQISDPTAAAVAMNTSVAMKHTMVSYCWVQQPAVKRVHAALVKRGYTGADRRRADAQVDGGQRGGGGGECVRGADRSVSQQYKESSQQYKESSNCQVEAQCAGGGAVRDAA